MCGPRLVVQGFQLSMKLPISASVKTPVGVRASPSCGRLLYAIGGRRQTGACRGEREGKRASGGIARGGSKIQVKIDRAVIFEDRHDIGVMIHLRQ